VCYAIQFFLSSSPSFLLFLSPFAFTSILLFFSFFSSHHISPLGVDIDILDMNGHKALYYASLWGHNNVEDLLTQSAKPKISSPPAPRPKFVIPPKFPTSPKSYLCFFKLKERGFTQLTRCLSCWSKARGGEVKNAPK